MGMRGTKKENEMLMERVVGFGFQTTSGGEILRHLVMSFFWQGETPFAYMVSLIISSKQHLWGHIVLLSEGGWWYKTTALILIFNESQWQYLSAQTAAISSRIANHKPLSYFTVSSREQKARLDKNQSSVRILCWQNEKYANEGEKLNYEVEVCPWAQSPHHADALEQWL